MKFISFNKNISYLLISNINKLFYLKKNARLTHTTGEETKVECLN